MTNTNKILKFPGDNVTNKNGIIETKTVFLEKGVAQRMKVDYEGTLDANVESHPLENDDISKKETPMSDFTPNKWKGIAPSIGRIRSFSIKLYNATSIKNLILIYKQRIKK